MKRILTPLLLTGLLFGPLGSSTLAETQKNDAACGVRSLLDQKLFSGPVPKADWQHILRNRTKDPFVQTFLPDIQPGDTYTFQDSYCYHNPDDKVALRVTFTTPRLGIAVIDLIIDDEDITSFSFYFDDDAVWE